MAKRPTDSGLPRPRIPGKALADAQAETTRCTATEGAQQCLREAGHNPFKNHSWGSLGDTGQWFADGTAKPVRVDATFRAAPAVVPDPWTCPVVKYDFGGRYRCDMHAPHDDPSKAHVWVLVDDTDVLPAVPPPPRDGTEADPPATPDVSESTPESSVSSMGAGSGGGSGRSLERPGQVAAAFGTSSADVPFQAALMSVLVPAAHDSDAHVLANEMAQLGGLLATAGHIASEYHRHGRLAEPGLLVGLRFQVNALCVGRGLAP